MSKELKPFVVIHEKGEMSVMAEDEAEAIERYWEAIESIVGHQEGSCKCYTNPAPFDRSRWSQVIRVEEKGRVIKGNFVFKSTLS